MTDFLNIHKRRTYRWSLAVCLLFLAVLFVLLNLQPFRWYSCPTLVDHYTEQPHGVPLTYMLRDEYVAGTNMRRTIHGCWPFMDQTPPCCDSCAWVLAVDIAFGAILTAIVSKSLAKWLAQRSSIVRRLCLGAMLVILLCWIVSALACMEYHLVDTTVAQDRCIPYSYAPAIYCLMGGPLLLYPVVLSLAFTELLRWTLPSHLRLAERPDVATLNAVLVGLFMFCVVLEWRDFGESQLELVTSAASALLLLLLSMKFILWLCPAKKSLPTRKVTPQFYGMHFTTWLWTALMACTLGTFALFQETAYSCDYGWPWTHFRVQNISYSFAGYWTRDRGQNGLLDWPFLLANFAVLVWITAGTAVATQSLVAIQRVQWKFGVSNLLSITTAIAVVLTLWEPAGRTIMWPNWFVELMAGLGLGCAGYLLARLPEKVWRRCFVREEGEAVTTLPVTE